MNTALKAGLRTGALAALLAPALVLVPGAAQAAPSGCSGAYNLEYQNTYAVYCSKGTGEYRARARCYRIGSENYTTRYGTWKRPGGTVSTVFCQSNEEVASGSWELRG
ncbi:hypothetical protein [Micromonospora sp. NPDC003241]